MKDKVEIWTFEGLLWNFQLSEDGGILAGIPDEWNHVTLKALTSEEMKKAIVVEFHHRDQKVVRLTLDQVMKKPKSLQTTDYPNQYAWGSILGFNDRNQLVIDTIERHRYLVDPSTARVISHTNLNAKI